jgi:hypothetical protein
MGKEDGMGMKTNLSEEFLQPGRFNENVGGCKGELAATPDGKGFGVELKRSA